MRSPTRLSGLREESDLVIGLSRNARFHLCRCPPPTAVAYELHRRRWGL